MIRYLAPLALLVLLAPGIARAGTLTIAPGSVLLQGKDARQRLLITETLAGRAVDRSRSATYAVEGAAVAVVSADGVVTATADGEAVIVARFGEQTARVPVRVRGSQQLPAVTFERDIQPILARYGCNSGPCHGKARGQNGFALSLLGYDSDFDFAALTQEGRGRRIYRPAPEHSLILRKAAGLVPHGGGKRTAEDGPAYARLRHWIETGCQRTPATTPKLVRISIEPGECTLAPKTEQQLLVTAHYSDDSTEDVTHLATYQSNESPLAAVDANGLIRTGPLPGETAIMVRYQEKFAVCNVLLPLAGSVPTTVYEKLPRTNFIDGHVWTKLQQLGITPSVSASEATFHRRVYLDLIGRLPTPEETRAFLADTRPLAEKKAALIDRLLTRPEYADFWANKWADLLRPNPYRVGIKAVFNLDAWLRDSFRKNKPYDVFVRELLTAQGSTFRNGATVLFRDRREPAEITTMVSQLFLGIRLDCARCHHHPFEVWSQDDFFSLSAYFARIGRKGTGLSPPISGGEEMITLAATGTVKHPLTGQVLPPRPLFGKAEVKAEDDPREVFAAWVTSPDNPYFAKVIVNRVWADLMGRGMVDPVDDLRATNPPSNGPLLDALADDFRKHGYDLKHLLRQIATSHVYGLSSLPGDRNVSDTRNYSRHYRQRLRAEVLLDAVSDITGVPESFSAMPPGSRAMELWTARAQSIFLDSFGRPDPNQDPPCERMPDTTVVQALHLMNSPNLHRKVTASDGRVAKLTAGKLSNAEIVEELYLLAYCRKPTTEEAKACLRWFDRPGTKRREAAEDLLWVLINTPEFVFND